MDYELVYTGHGGSSLRGGEDAKNKAVMVRACEKEEHRCPVGRYERLALIALRRGRGGLNKNWREVVIQNMTHL